MRKRKLLTVGFFLFLSVGLLATTPGGFFGKAQDQGQQEKPRFYALRVVSEKNVKNAKDSLGAPDGHYAEILPGGQLVLLMEKRLYVFPVGSQDYGGGLAYNGVIVAKGETTSVFEGWLPINEAQGGGHAWITIGQALTIYYILPEPIMRADLVRITNTGTESLFVDAIIGLDREAVRR